jgi:NADPH:quinone reductase-like Zn-dependent oxidoreductase
MKRWIIDRDTLRFEDAPEPPAAAGEVLVRVRACSLNYRDLMILRGEYGEPGVSPLVPLSDCAGEVVSVGEGVEDYAPGDRVAGCLFQNWESGPIHQGVYGSDLGFSLPGVLSELRAFPAGGLVKLPRYLSFAEGATLPVAGVTAYRAVVPHVAEGSVVLLLGTGGVSLFALQLAKLSGARVIITSSSDEKLARAADFGADHTINYHTHENWDELARGITDGRGVDLVVETGGAATFEKSVNALAPGGTVAQVGRLTGIAAGVNIQPLVYKAAKLQGVFAGSRADFVALNALVERMNISALVDDLVPFEEAPRAYERLKSARHFGKVVVTLDQSIR